MSGLWKKDPETKGGKYLVKRRDGTIPEWPHFVLGARDIVAPFALRAYADEAERLGFDPTYISDIREMAFEFEQYLINNGSGDPDAPRHRIDDPETVAQMINGKGA